MILMRFGDIIDDAVDKTNQVDKTIWLKKRQKKPAKVTYLST